MFMLINLLASIVCTEFKGTFSLKGDIEANYHEDKRITKLATILK